MNHEATHTQPDAATTGALSIAPADDGLFDLDSIEDVGSAEVELLHPLSGKPTGAFVTLAGPEHPDRKRLTFGLIRRARQDAARQAASLRAGRQAAVTAPEEDLEESIDLLVGITLAWRGFKKDGAPLACTEANKRAMFYDPKRQWVVKQLTEAMQNTNLFIKA